MHESKSLSITTFTFSFHPGALHPGHPDHDGPGTIRIRNLEDLIRQLEHSSRHMSPSGSEDIRESEAERHFRYTAFIREPLSLHFHFHMCSSSLTLIERWDPIVHPNCSNCCLEQTRKKKAKLLSMMEQSGSEHTCTRTVHRPLFSSLFPGKFSKRTRPRRAEAGV